MIAIAGEIDFAGIALVLTAVGAIVTAILEHLGRRKAAAAVKRVTLQAETVIEGVERAGNGENLEVLRKSLADVGIEIDRAQAKDVLGQLHKSVKKTIKDTAFERGVQLELHELVQKQTGKLSRQRLRDLMKSEPYPQYDDAVKQWRENTDSVREAQ